MIQASEVTWSLIPWISVELLAGDALDFTHLSLATTNSIMYLSTYLLLDEVFGFGEQDFHITTLSFARVALVVERIVSMDLKSNIKST